MVVLHKLLRVHYLVKIKVSLNQVRRMYVKILTIFISLVKSQYDIYSIDQIESLYPEMDAQILISSINNYKNTKNRKQNANL